MENSSLTDWKWYSMYMNIINNYKLLITPSSHSFSTDNSRNQRKKDKYVSSMDQYSEGQKSIFESIVRLIFS